MKNLKATTQNAKLVEHRSTTVKKKELKFGGNARNAVTLKVKAIGDVAVTFKKFPKLIDKLHAVYYLDVEGWRGDTAQKLRFLLDEDEELQHMSKRELVEKFLEALKCH